MTEYTVQPGLIDIEPVSYELLDNGLGCITIKNLKMAAQMELFQRYQIL